MGTILRMDIHGHHNDPDGLPRPVTIFLEAATRVMDSLAKHLESCHDGGGTGERLARIESLLTRLLEKERTMSATLDKLTATVSKNRDATQSAILLIKGLAQQIRDAGTDTAALETLAADLDGQATTLASAVLENTSASPGNPGTPGPGNPGGTPQQPNETDEQFQARRNR